MPDGGLSRQFLRMDGIGKSGSSRFLRRRHCASGKIAGYGPAGEARRVCGLEAVAAPGGICLSRAAYDQVEGKVAAEFRDAGDQELKNIAPPDGLPSGCARGKLP